MYMFLNVTPCHAFQYAHYQKKKSAKEEKATTDAAQVQTNTFTFVSPKPSFLSRSPSSQTAS